MLYAYIPDSLRILLIAFSKSIPEATRVSEIFWQSMLGNTSLSICTSLAQHSEELDKEEAISEEETISEDAFSVDKDAFSVDKDAFSVDE
jgi:hypothetical protein